MLIERPHPSQANKYRIKQNMLSGEIEAAKAFDYAFDVSLTEPRNWFDLPRETRAVLVAKQTIDALERGIIHYEQEQEAKRKASRPKGG